MPPITISTILQAIVGIELLLVWVVRARWATDFRGGDAKTLKEEFATYGLPDWVFYAVGALKIPAAILLLVGLWVPEVVLPAAGVIVVLMAGALAMHARVRDPWIKFRPAATVFLMSAAIVILRLV